MAKIEELEKEFMGFLENMIKEISKEQEDKIKNEQLKESISNIEKLTDNIKSIIERKDTFNEKDFANYIVVSAIKVLDLQKVVENQMKILNEGE